MTTTATPARAPRAGTFPAAVLLALALGCTGPAHSTDGGAAAQRQAESAGRADGTSCRSDGECASGFCKCASSCRSGCCAPAEKRGDTMCTMDCRDLRCPNG